MVAPTHSTVFRAVAHRGDPELVAATEAPGRYLLRPSPTVGVPGLRVW